jgi:hypothetical protein
VLNDRTCVVNLEFTDAAGKPGMPNVARILLMTYT